MCVCVCVCVCVNCLGSLLKQSNKTIANDLWLYFILGAASPEIEFRFKFREDPWEQMSKSQTMLILIEDAVLQVCGILIKYMLFKN